jgi:hypothetical protein
MRKLELGGQADISGVTIDGRVLCHRRLAQRVNKYLDISGLT